jgi:hypothetical protein
MHSACVPARAAPNGDPARPAQLPLGDAIEPGPVEVVGANVPLGVGVHRQEGVTCGTGLVFAGDQTGHGDRSRYFVTLDQKHAAVRR